MQLVYVAAESKLGVYSKNMHAMNTCSFVLCAQCQCIGVVITQNPFYLYCFSSAVKVRIFNIHNIYASNLLCGHPVLP